MGIKADISESKPEGGGGNYFSERCNCHFIVKGWEDHSKHGYVEIEFVSLESDVKSQVGKERSERFYLAPKSIGKLLEWACAVGIYSKPRWAADKANGVSPDIEIENAIGKQFCAPVAMNPFDVEWCKKQIEKYTAAGDTVNLAKEQEKLTKNVGKSFAQVGGDSGFTYWALGDLESDKVPLDMAEAAQMAEATQFGDMLPTKQGTTRKRGSHPVTSAPVTPPANAPVNPASSFL